MKKYIINLSGAARTIRWLLSRESWTSSTWWTSAGKGISCGVMAARSTSQSCGASSGAL